MRSKEILDDATDRSIKLSFDEIGVDEAFNDYKKIGIPEGGFSKEDCEIGVAMLGLGRNIKNVKVPRRQITTYIKPNLEVFSIGGMRTQTDHDLQKTLYESTVGAEFLGNAEFQKAEVKRETVKDKDGKEIFEIDASEFDEESFGVLELINKIIQSTDQRRDKAQKKTTNQIVKVVEDIPRPLALEYIPARLPRRKRRFARRML